MSVIAVMRMRGQASKPKTAIGMPCAPSVFALAAKTTSEFGLDMRIYLNSMALAR